MHIYKYAVIVIYYIYRIHTPTYPTNQPSNQMTNQHHHQQITTVRIGLQCIQLEYSILSSIRVLVHAFVWPHRIV